MWPNQFCTEMLSEKFSIPKIDPEKIVHKGNQSDVYSCSVDKRVKHFPGGLNTFRWRSFLIGIICRQIPKMGWQVDTGIESRGRLLARQLDINDGRLTKG